MKAITIDDDSDGPILRDVQRPRCDADEARVHVVRVGIDGTDRELVYGDYGDYPEGDDYLITGHESIGVVEATGDSVTSLEKGDLVVATVRRPGHCVNCQAGQQDMCLEGDYTERGIKGAHGYLRPYYTEKEDFLVKLPDTLGLDGVFLEPTSIAEKAIRRAYEARSHHRWEPRQALVTGGGTLGILTAALLRLRGLDVAITDLEPSEKKQDVFERLGLTWFDAANTELHDVPGELGKQVDLIIESTGSSTVAMHTMSVVGTNGVSVLLSVTPGDDEVELCAACLNQGLVLENKDIIGSVNAHPDDFQTGVSDLLAAKQRWEGFPNNLITSTYDLDSFEEAVDTLDDNIKTVIQVSDYI